MILQWIAQSRIRIESARLLILKTAWLMDTVGNKGAHTEIQAIKILTPEVTTWVLDRAVQSFGGAGVSQDTPLAALWAGARTLHLADGPDEVHEASLGRREIKKYLVWGPPVGGQSTRPGSPLRIVAVSCPQRRQSHPLLGRELLGREPK